MMNENYNTPNSGCCGRPFVYNTTPKCKYNDCCMNEYAYKQKACIRNKQPDCESQAVIPSITVETVDGISNLANCLVHVTSTNTTYYVDDKHRIMITWAGPVNIPGYDMEANPNHYKNQIVTDTEAETAVIYDNQGKGYIFGITPENLQQAINDKLDEMTVDGTLEDILLNYATVSKVYNTTREMLTDGDNLVVGEKVRTLGYYTLNDGGGAEFVITNTTTSRYQITLGDGKYATLISRNINVDQLGANGGNNALSVYFDTLENAQKVYPNATSLTALVGGVAIQCAINYFHDNKIELNANTYYISSGLSTNTSNRVHLCGNAKWKSVIRKIGVEQSENTILILGSSSSRNVIENIDFVGPDNPTDTTQATLESYKTNGILFNSSSYNQINNCVFRQCNSGIKFVNSWTNTITDCYFARCNNGIMSAGASANNCLEINHCFAEYCNYGIYLGEGRSQIILNCDVENCNVNGVRKTNEGDIQILSSYFESKIEISYGQTYTRNVLISGCSFYQNSANNAFYTPIVFSGNTSGGTQVTIQNCNFVDDNSGGDYSNNPAIMQLNNATTIPPVLINNTVTNMIEFRPVYMRGIHIKNGILENYFHRSYAQNNINCSDGGVTTLTLTGGLNHRVNLMDSGTHTIKFPSLDASDRYINHSFTFVVPSNNSATRLGTVTLIPADSATCEVAGHTTISISDKNKLITATYVGNFSSKDHWAVSVSA